MGHFSRVSEVLDETDMSHDQKASLILGNGDVSLNGLVLESRKQVMTSATAMNFAGGSTWRKQSMRNMDHAFEDLPSEQYKRYRIEQIQKQVFH